MASWLPPLQDCRHGSPVRLGRHVVPDREVELLAERLGEIEDHLANRVAADGSAEDDASRALCDVARIRVTRDLELLRAALGRTRTHLAAH